MVRMYMHLLYAAIDNFFFSLEARQGEHWSQGERIQNSGFAFVELQARETDMQTLRGLAKRP